MTLLLAVHDGVASPAWHVWVLAGAWVVAFLLPAIWVGRHARRRGVPAGRWVVLVLVTSFLGVVQYFMDKSIEERKARRRASSEEALGAGAQPPSEGGP